MIHKDFLLINKTHSNKIRSVVQLGNKFPSKLFLS